MSINRVVLSGNLTRDPEVRVTASGMQVMTFGIAVNDRRRNSQTGEWEDYPNFFDCTMFGNRAESVSRFISKGQRVFLEGRLRYSTWNNNEGQKRSKVEVIVDEIDFSGTRNQGMQDGGYQSQQNSYAPTDASAYSAPSTPVVDTNSSVYDEDIPF